MSTITDRAAYDRTEQSDAMLARLERAIKEMCDGLAGLHDEGWPVGGACDALSDCLGALGVERLELQADLADWRREQRGVLVQEPFMGGAA